MVILENPGHTAWRDRKYLAALLEILPCKKPKGFTFPFCRPVKNIFSNYICKPIETKGTARFWCGHCAFLDVCLLEKEITFILKKGNILMTLDFK